MFKSLSLEVIGDQKLHCESCEQRVARVLGTVKGVHQVRANARSQRVDVLFDPAETAAPAIIDRLELIGYAARPAASPAQAAAT